MKQLLRFFLFLVTTGVLLTACQKELNFEIGNAKGTIAKDANNNCAPITTNGSYVKNVALAATNYIDVQVNITELGNYIIKTDTVNGYYFYDSSAVAILGVNTFRLKGYGTPVNASIDDFVVSFDGSTCDVSIVVTATPGGGSGAAEFTLMGSPNACANAKQSNNFFATIPTLAAVNHDTIYVDVTATGTYTINATTTPSNGLTFSKSGTFTATGPNQPVILEAVGTPSTAGSIPYTITTTSPASNCGFNLTVQALPAPATFTFNCGLPIYTGTYQVGTSTLGNTVTILVTSPAGGAYNISSSTTVNNNGVTFAGIGVLQASPLPQPVVLFAVGSPTATGLFTYTLKGTGNPATCTIDRTYTAAVVSNGTITAFINGGTTLSTFNLNASGNLDITTFPGNSSLVITGATNNSPTSPLITLSANKAGPILANTTFTTTSPMNIASGQYDNTTGASFYASPLGGNISITITSITTTPPLRVVGTFFGTLKDNVGLGPNTAVFTTGNFDIPYQ
jgi:hypothetical protein